MSRKNHSHLRAAFDAAFVFPFARYAWKSERARSFWIDLEGWQDNLAGPVSHIIEHGGCAFVYDRNDDYFTGVDDPATLRARLQGWHGEMMTGLKQFVPTSEAEANDLACMRQFAEEMWAIAEQALQVERARWEKSD